MPAYKLPEIIEQQKIQNCFVCFAQMNEATYTLEHIIPQWILKKFDIYKRQLRLSDELTIRYTDFLLPCCRTCNTNLLGQREKTISAVFNRETKTFSEVDMRVFAMWATKINIANELYSLAVSGEDLKEVMFDKGYWKRDFFQLLKDTSRGIDANRSYTTISGLNMDFPFSFFVFPTKLPESELRQFRYFFQPSSGAFYLRMGRFTIVCVNDAGYIQEYGNGFLKRINAFNRELSCLQSEEIASHIFAMHDLSRQTMLSRRTSKTIKWDRRSNSEIEKRPIPLEDFPDFTLYQIKYYPIMKSKPFQEDGFITFNKYVSEIIGIDTSEMAEGVCWTCLNDSLGNPVEMDANLFNENYDQVAYGLRTNAQQSL